MFSLLRELRHALYPSRKVVFHQGEIGREFYIILSGSVYVIGNEDKELRLAQTVDEQPLPPPSQTGSGRGNGVTNF